jgi:hypothetical protein
MDKKKLIASIILIAIGIGFFCDRLLTKEPRA